jgi:hypothetical protein
MADAVRVAQRAGHDTRAREKVQVEHRARIVQEPAFPRYKAAEICV